MSSSGISCRFKQTVTDNKHRKIKSNSEVSSTKKTSNKRLLKKHKKKTHTVKTIPAWPFFDIFNLCWRKRFTFILFASSSQSLNMTPMSCCYLSLRPINKIYGLVSMLSCHRLNSYGSRETLNIVFHNDRPKERTLRPDNAHTQLGNVHYRSGLRAFTEVAWGHLQN